MPIPTFKFKNLTRTDLLQFDGVNFVNVPVYTVGKNVMWGPGGVGYNSLIIGDVTKNISLVGHKHTTDDILGLQELINDLGSNSNSGTSIDLSKYLLTSTFIDHLNNINSAKHVTQEHLDKLNSLSNYWQLDAQGNLYTTYNTYSTQELTAWKNGDYSGFTFSLWDAADVELSELTTDDLLKYNGTKWVNIPMSSLVTGGGGGTEYILPTASATILGGIKVGQRLSINNGVLSADVQSNNYSLPTASATTLGGIKVGDGLTISSGVLSVVGGGGGSNVSWDTQYTTQAIELTVEGTKKILSLSSHTHDVYSITGLVNALNNKQDKLTAGTGITISGNTISATGGGGSNVSWGSTSNNYSPLTVEGISKTVALTGHTHPFTDITGVATTIQIPNLPTSKITSGTFDIARIPTGTTATTVALGNDSRINNGQTAYGWGNHASAGYAFSSALSNYAPINNPTFTGLVTAPTFVGALSGNATTATTATKLGTATVGSTQLPIYLDAGTATAITQANLRIGLFGATAIGSSTKPVYIAANGVPTESTSFGGVTGIGTASPLMDGTVAVGTSTLAARQDHRHPVDTSRAAVGQTMYIGTTAVAINRASATLNLTGIGSLAMAGALSGATTISASTSVTTPKVIFTAAGWSMEQSTGGVLELKYNGVVKQKFLNDGSIAATGELTAYVAGASGYSEFLPLSGGTLTGNLNIGTGVIIGTANIPLSVRGSTFKYNNSDVLYKGMSSIGLSDGWTIEIQTSPSALLIKKNGVVKGTFNA